MSSPPVRLPWPSRARRRAKAPAVPRRHPDPQRGYALLIMLIILVMGSLYGVVSQLDAVQVKYLQVQGTSGSLRQAKEALIGYAATYRDTHSGEVFGYLPCPSTYVGSNSDMWGTADSSCAAGAIGLLPYKTLGLPDLRDADGNCLWYAVSGNFKNSAQVPPLNWDTQGQFTIAGTSVAPDQGDGGASAVIIAPGAALTAHATQANGPCRVDPTGIASYLESYASATNTFTPGAPGTSNNDILAWITPKEIFDRIVKRADFSNALAASPVGQINKLTDEIRAVLEKRMQDDLVAGGTPASSLPNTAGYTPFGKQIGSLPATMSLNDANYNKYYSNWSDQYRSVLCSSLTAACLTIAGTACRGALMFSGRTVAGQPRPGAWKAPATTNLAYYFESGSGLDILNSAATTYSGSTTYSARSPSADVGACLFPGAFISSAQDIASFASGTVNESGAAVAAVNTTAQSVALGNIGGGTNAGAVWYPTALPLGSMLRLYFRFQVTTKGNGFALALADGATNQAPNNPTRSQKMLGAADNASLGYAGTPPSGASAGIKAPKLGIEFDTLHNPSRYDPPGDHMAFLFWGTSADNGPGGSGADDNTHYLGIGGTQVGAANWDSAGKTTTFTTPAAHGLAVGQTVIVSGVTPSAYNGTYTVLAAGLTSTQFAVTVTTDPGAYTSGGMIRTTASGIAPRNPRVATATVNAPTTIVPSGLTAGGSIRYTSWDSTTKNVTIVTSGAHGLSVGDQVVISGVDPPAYNGTFKVVGVLTQPYRFRYSMASNPGTYNAGGIANKVTGTEISNLAWVGGTALAASPSPHGLTTGQNIATFGITPAGFDATANLTYIDSNHFSFPISDPSGSFSTETPAGMALVKTGDAYMPRSSLPLNTAASVPCNDTGGIPCVATGVIHVRLDISRTYDATNHVAMLSMKAYIGDTFPLSDLPCDANAFQNLSRDLVDVCRNSSGITNRTVTIQQDSVPIADLAAISNVVWDAATQRATVATTAPHGLASGSIITLSGANPGTFNGTYTISVTGSNTFSFPLASDPGWISGGSIQPFTTIYLGFTSARGSSNSGEDQNVVISNLLLRSQ